MSDALVKDTYCSFCGTRYDAPDGYPRTCANCGTVIWANPIPVVVVLIGVRTGNREGLLVVRRSIEPRCGFLGIVGGFLEVNERWQIGGAREVAEETGLVIDPDELAPFWYASSAPDPNRVLLFCQSPAIGVADLPPFTGNDEADDRGLVFGPGGLAEVFAFSTHIEAAERFFAERAITGPYDYQSV